MAFLHHHARRVAFDSHKADHARVHNLRRLPRSAQLSQLIEALETDGCVIIKDFTDEATLEEADREVQPWLENQDDGAKVGGTILFARNHVYLSH